MVDKGWWETEPKTFGRVCVVLKRVEKELMWMTRMGFGLIDDGAHGGLGSRPRALRCLKPRLANDGLGIFYVKDLEMGTRRRFLGTENL
jgi:hypothetical protein